MTQRTLWFIVFAAAFVLMLTMGMRMSLGLFMIPLVNDPAISVGAFSFAMAVNQLMWGVAQPATGALADRFGAWPVIFWGTLLLVAGFALMPLWLNDRTLILTLGIMVAFGTGAGSHAILMSQVAQKIPPRLRGTASGIVNAGGSFGQTVFAPLLQTLILVPAIAWQGALWALAAISLLILPVARWLTRSEGGVATVTNDSEQTLRAALKTAFRDRSYFLLHLGFFTCGFHIAFLVTHLPQEIALCGLPPEVASWSIAIIGMANVLGCLAAGWGVSRFRSKYLLFWMYASRTALIALYLAAPRTDLVFYLFAIGLGFTWLATVPPTAAIVGKLFGIRYLATLFGLTLLSHQIGAFFGAWLGGKAYLHFANYQWMWYADMLLASLAALLNLPIREARVLRTQMA
ncbi:MAG: MFS transporter [Cardiobacteriaceae bacterium]|nr:MFS transporter [Cardiobacteriaceae bacterium]